MKIAAFDAMDAGAKQAALMHIKSDQARRREDYLLALHGMTDQDMQIRLAAKLACQAFASQPYFMDLKGLSPDDIRAKIAERFPELQDGGPVKVERQTPTKDFQKISSDLQARTKHAESLNGVWGGPFPPQAMLLNALRTDTQELITGLLHPGESYTKAYIAFFNEQFTQFRECRRSLDSNAATTLVNLSNVRPNAVSPEFATLFSLVERPIYLLILLTDKRLILFLRDQLNHTAAAVHAITCSLVTALKGLKTPLGFDIEFETPQDIIKLPHLENGDGLELEKLLRERSAGAAHPPDAPPKEPKSAETPPAGTTAQADAQAKGTADPAFPAATPALCAEGIRSSVKTALDWYKKSVQLGRPRNPELETWFSLFINNLQGKL